MIHPKDQSQDKSLHSFKEGRFNPELLPNSMFDSIEYWSLISICGSEPMFMLVSASCIKFRNDFRRYIEHSTENQIPEMMKACKNRTSHLVNFCQSVLSALEKGYRLVPCTKDYSRLESNFNVRFARNIVAINDEDYDDYFDFEIDVVGNPRVYRHLYAALIIALNSNWRKSALDFLCIWIQSEAYIYESVNFTDSEIIEAENDFIRAALTPDIWEPDCELANIIRAVSKDMSLKRSAPAYISDFAMVRQRTDGYIYNHPWTIDDASFSTSGSSSRLVIDGNRVPNIGLIYSAFEQDRPYPGDDLIHYKSLYSNEHFEGMTQFESSTTFVPKTSSRGIRGISPNDGPRQDRGCYYEHLGKDLIKYHILCDSTYDDNKGIEFIRKYESNINNNEPYVLVCVDAKASTDMWSHTFLHWFWSLIFKDPIADLLMEIHSGKGILHHHRINDDGVLVKVTEEYNQLSGIKCGTMSNFAVGLTLPHNFLVRCTMKYFGLDSVNPESLYVVHGDDITFALPKSLFDKGFIDKYIQLCGEAGLRIHPLSEKGMISHSTDLCFRAEFNKQTWSNDRLVSRVPHRLFFQRSDFEGKIQFILWLSQYDYIGDSKDILRTTLDQQFNPQLRTLVYKAWNFFIKKEVFGISKYLYFDDIGDASETENFNFALQMFSNVLSVGVFEAVFNNRQRLENYQLKAKIREFTQIYHSDDKEDQLFLRHVIELAFDWLETHGIFSAKLQEVYDKNLRFADEVYQIFDMPWLWLSSALGFFSEDQKEIIHRCLPYFRVSNLELSPTTVDDLLKATRILKDTQPHSISKRTHVGSSILVSVLRSLAETNI